MWWRDSPASSGPGPHRHADLRGDQDLVPPAVEHLADDLLGRARRVDVGGVDEVHAVVEALVDLATRLLHAGRADGREAALATERHGAHGERGNHQAGTAERTVLHPPTIPSGAGSSRLGARRSLGPGGSVPRPRVKRGKRARRKGAAMSTATFTRTDAEIQQDVIDELRWDARLQPNNIAVAVRQGVVTLAGWVDNYTKRWLAERAAHRVRGGQGGRQRHRGTAADRRATAGLRDRRGRGSGAGMGCVRPHRAHRRDRREQLGHVAR